MQPGCALSPGDVLAIHLLKKLSAGDTMLGVVCQIATLRELTGTSVAECPTFTMHPRRMKSLGLPRR